MKKRKTKKNYRAYKYYNDTYGFTTHLFVGTYKACDKWLRRKFNYVGDEDNTADYGGLSWVLVQDDGRTSDSFIWLPNFKGTVDDYVTLSHECLHIAYESLYRRGVRIHNSDTEQLNYLQDALYRAFLLKLKKGK